MHVILQQCTTTTTVAATGLAARRRRSGPADARADVASAVRYSATEGKR